MHDEYFAQLLIESTVVQLQIDEYFIPDLRPPEDYQGPQLVAIAHAGRLATLGSTGRLVRELSPETSVALLQAAQGAHEEVVREGYDTATGRTLTVLYLHVDHPRGLKHSFTCRAVINHHVPRALPPQWSALLRLMRDSAGLLSGEAADAWDRALTWTSPVDLGPVWLVGAPVRLPHLVTSVAHDGALYIRTGQPPQASSLYLLSEGVLTCLDDQRVIAPVNGRFVLPCGGGTLTLRREWQTPLRIVIRADDDRGIYVQRA